MKKSAPIRYAVVGLGWIAQASVLPGFRQVGKNSLLTALVSGDAVKLKKLGRKYKVKNLYSYEQYEECLKSGLIDAVYIALPNHLHAEYSIRAAKAGIHVLCEKPMAMTEAECRSMITAAHDNSVRLMVAYRLHFEKANLKAIELVKKGAIGKLRSFHSIFSMQVKAGNIRLQQEYGGGPLRDLGIYCINAARYLYQSEPLSTFAFNSHKGHRFVEVEEMDTVLLKFPEDGTAAFTCSFGAQDLSRFTLLGTKGEITLDNAYEIIADKTLHLKKGKNKQTFHFKPSDQFGPELLYFSDCIQKNRQPEPSGLEGLNDVRVIEAIQKAEDKSVIARLEPQRKLVRPSKKQLIYRRLPPKQKLIHTSEPDA